MHSPSLLTPMVANEVIESHTESARSYHASRARGSSLFGRFRRRPGASRPLVPRARTLPPFAH